MGSIVKVKEGDKTSFSAIESDWNKLKNIWKAEEQEKNFQDLLKNVTISPVMLQIF